MPNILPDEPIMYTSFLTWVPYNYAQPDMLWGHYEGDVFVPAEATKAKYKIVDDDLAFVVYRAEDTLLETPTRQLRFTLPFVCADTDIHAAAGVVLLNIGDQPQEIGMASIVDRNGVSEVIIKREGYILFDVDVNCVVRFTGWLTIHAENEP